MGVPMRKIGDKLDIICPNCDGTGYEEMEIINNIDPLLNEIPKICEICNGTGKVEAIVTK